MWSEISVEWSGLKCSGVERPGVESGVRSGERGVERNHPGGVLTSYMISCDFPFSCGGYDPSRGFASDAEGRGAPHSTSGSHCNPDSLGRRSPAEGSVKSTVIPWSSVARVGVCLVASITHMSCIPAPPGNKSGASTWSSVARCRVVLLCQTHTIPLGR